VQRLAARLVQRVRRRADVTTGAASGYALQDQALIRPDDPRRRVVRQDLILQRDVPSESLTRRRGDSSEIQRQRSWRCDAARIFIKAAVRKGRQRATPLSPFPPPVSFSFSRFEGARPREIGRAISFLVIF